MNRSCSQSSNLNQGLNVSQGRGGLGAGEAGVKIGGLWKRSQGVSRFTKPNYKHRVFILTEQALSYYQGTIDRIGQLKGRVALDTVRAVEFVEDGAFKLAHTFQVVYQSKKHGFVTLYVTATDNKHCADWVASLRQACYFNRDMLMHFHPGAMMKGKWSCCSQQGKTTLGCQPTYHLLTRSSSRYAQMRRRDTLTSTGHRRPRNNTTGPYSTLDRQSLANCSHIGEVDGNHAVQGGRPGQGLSNSCMNLTIHAPQHRIESFVANDDTTSGAGDRDGGDLASQRSSRVSTDHSVGMDSITLTTRVAMRETTPTGFEGEGPEGDYEDQSAADMDVSGGSERRLSQGRQYGSKRQSRSQVAPEPDMSTPAKHFPLCRSHPLEMEHKSLTLPNPKSKSRVKSVESQRYVNSMELACEGSPAPHPVPPPRHHRKHHPLATTTPNSLTGSIHYIPPNKPSSDATTAPTKLQQGSEESSMDTTGRLKHSHTFAVQCRNQAVSRAIEQHLAPHAQLMPKNCSQSMNALSKPMIEPKFSLTNPNVVHV